ncbi:MAG TPA: pyridoxamine 5'-phosphate oxidase, partial [Leptospiraceae bacterium]|nr:pyridoxamine 5'-phosphate oxidase [Leptospiraceae bacterium]
MPIDPSSLRKEYTAAGLLEESAGFDPFALFDRWFHEAVAAEVREPTAMTLATSNRQGSPSARIVLMKGYDERGIIFYTNYESHKANDLAENPQAALLFFWAELERQVRIEGSITKTSRKESDEYFQSRPLESRIGAHASNQSKKIESREVLTQKVREIEAKFGSSVPIPDQ